MGDPYFDQVQLLLSMDGTNGSTTFTDKSNNGLTVTANGNAAISTSESKFGGASAAFDGTGDFIQTAASTALQLGTDDFTIEAWVYFTALDANTTVARLSGGNNIDSILFCHAVSSGAGKLFITSNGSTWDVRNNGSDFTGLTTNEWFHLALSRNGTTFRTFVNGTLISTFTSSASIYQSSNVARIGAANSSGAFAMGGYIDDFRITKGFCRYTADFAPPTLPFATAGSVQLDPYFENYVSLLLHMDGANGSTIFTDESTNTLTVTANGDAQISTSQSKFGGASAAFDGTGDYLAITDNAALDFTDGSDFTIEFWFYRSGTSGVGFFGRGGGAPNWSTSNGHYYLAYILSGGLYVQYNYGGGVSTPISLITTAPGVSTWNHFAMVRSSGTITAYLNGTSFGSSTAALVAPTTRNITRIGDVPSGGSLWNGYIDDFRITRGIARYTANFTPPTKAFPDTLLTNDLYFDNVSLLLPMDGTNGSTTFTDESDNGLTVTANGNAAISTSESKFGGASAYFDGNGDRVSVANNAVLDFGNGDFTVECWVRSILGLASYSLTYAHILGKGNGGGGGTYSLVFYNSKVGWVSNGSIKSGTSTLTNNTWYHFAACRSGSTLRLFVDGVQEYSATDTTDYTSSESFNAGDRKASDPSLNYPLNGYIDDLRITKGVARYTAAFTPPTRAHPLS